MTCFFSFLTISFGKTHILPSFSLFWSGQSAYHVVVCFLFYVLDSILLFTERLIYPMQAYYHHRSFGGSLLSRLLCPCLGSSTPGNRGSPSPLLPSYTALHPQQTTCCSLLVLSDKNTFLSFHWAPFPLLRMHSNPLLPNHKNSLLLNSSKRLFTLPLFKYQLFH